MNYSEYLIKFGCPLKQKKDILKMNYNIEMTEKQILSVVLSDTLNEMALLENYVNELETVYQKYRSTIDFKINNGIRHDISLRGSNIEVRDFMIEYENKPTELRLAKEKHDMYKQIENDFDHYMSLARLV